MHSNGVYLHLTGDHFCGCEQVINFSRDGGSQSKDYVEFYLNDTRKRWEWCSKFENGTINFGVHGAEGIVKVKYFREGGSFTSGTMIAELIYSLQNPVKFFDVPSTIEVGVALSIRCRMLAIPKSCRVIIRFDGVRILSRNITALENEFAINEGTLRLNGEYEVAIIATEGGDTVLWTRHLTVSDFYRRCDARLHCDAFDRSCKIITTQPHKELLFVTEGAILHSGD